MEVIYKYKMPTMIKDKQSKRLVYVLHKFVLKINPILTIFDNENLIKTGQQ